MARLKKVRSYDKLTDIFSVDDMAFYQAEPLAFIEDHIIEPARKILGKPNLRLTDQQKTVIRAVAHGEYFKTAVVSGKGIGKSGIAAMLTIWFLSVFDTPKIIITGPSYPQLTSVYWPELSKWLKLSSVRRCFEMTNERCYLPDESKEWWAEIRSAKKKESFQGLHTENLFILSDESSGIDDDIYEAITTTLSDENNKYLALSNGTRTDGWFADIFLRDSRGWNTLSFSSEDSPLVRKELIEDLEHRYGRDHDIFRVSILGGFPSGNLDSYISYTRAHAATIRDVPAGIPIEIGVDPARQGDDSTVITWRRGFQTQPQLVYRKLDNVEVVGKVIELVKKIRNTTGYTDRIKIKIDVGMGSGIIDTLKRDTENDIHVIPCNFGAAGTDRFENGASAMWGALEAVIDQISIPNDRILLEEISSRRAGLSASNRTLLEDKRSYKARIHRSPDRADSLVLCYYTPVEDRRMLPTLDLLDPITIRDEIIYLSSAKKLVVVGATPDGVFCALALGWDDYRFIVSDEIYGECVNVSEIASFINRTPFVDVLMTKNLCETDELKRQFKRFGIRTKGNMRYDEIGAIATLKKLITEKRFIVAKKCRNLIEQLSVWPTHGTGIRGIRDFPLPMALLASISKARDVIDPLPKQMNPVSHQAVTNYASRDQRSLSYNPFLRL